MAYRSYGAYYVQNGSLSSTFDICSNTACQKFDPNFKTTTPVTNAQSLTSGVILTSDGIHIFKAEHAAESNMADDVDSYTGQPLATCGDGIVGEPTQSWPCMKDFVCKGKQQSYTHSRGMCQRGSQRWATGVDWTGASTDTKQPILNSQGVPITPRDWRCILDHYYNANSNSKTVDPAGTGSPGAGSGLRTAFIQGQPTYGLVAYESSDGIHTASAADGTADKLIVSGSARYPSWEPGGARLAYMSSGGITIVNADGSAPQQLTNDARDFAPSWSPLGDRIAFCSTRSAPGMVDVWMVNVDGLTQPTNITNGTVASLNQGDDQSAYEEEACYLRWSPDGHYLTFTGNTSNAPYAGVWNVYSMNIDGTQAGQLTNCQINAGGSVSVCSTPSWSPDGTLIAFADGDTPFGDNIGGGGIYTVHLDGTGINPIYQDENSASIFPKWSCDGKKIFFSPGPSPYGLWSINADGTGLKQVIVDNSRKSIAVWGFDISDCDSFGY